MSRPFVIDSVWSALLNDHELRPADILRSAQLPEDLFSRERPTVTADGFLRLFEVMSQTLADKTLGLTIGQSVSSGVFSPPLFAAYCSPNLISATQRLSEYKPLVGPLKLEAHSMAGGLELTIDAEPGVVLPDEYIAAELVSVVNLARCATRHKVTPIAVEMIKPPNHPDYAKFFGHQILQGPFNRVVFSPEDAGRPFVSADPALFSFFDPDLRARLDELERGATLADRARSALMEALPSGQPEVGIVAKRLGMSVRTMQRRLGTEGTGFQEVLRELRARLARDYLSRTKLPSAEISFLLGYEDPNSFIRAFHTWTGTTPEAFRASGA